MSDWEESTDAAMDVVDKADVSSNNTGEQTGRRRRNDDNNNGGFNKQNDNDNNQGNRRRFNNGDNNNQEGGGGFRRRNNDDNNQEGGGFRRRNNDDGNQEGGGFRRRNNDDGNSNYQKRDSNDGNFRRRGNQNDQQNDQQNGQEGGYRRQRNNNNSMDVDQPQQDGGGERRRRNRDDNQQDNNENNNEQTGERRKRRDRNDDTGDNNPRSEITPGADGEKPKEKYISRRYTKEDDDLFDRVGEGINFAKFEHIPVQVSGENIPEPIQKFSDIATHNSVIEAVKKSGYTALTPIQKYGISIIMAGRDLMASAQTGSGKTMAFLLPIVETLLKNDDYKNYGEKCSPEALIVTPTRELAIQIFEQAMKLTYKNEVKPAVVYGGALSRDQQSRISYGANIIVATPGRLLDFLDKQYISLEKLKYFVLDEADRMIDQGFIPSVKRCVDEFDMPKDRLTMMFSATFPEEVQRLAQQFLKPDYIFLSVGVLGAANSDVKQEIRQVEFKQKKNELLNILKEIYSPTERILIFCEKKKTVDFLAANLCDRDYKTTSIHGDRLQSQREQALASFKKGETPILTASSVAARGLDIRGVTYVINYDLPSEIEEYVHRIGRTGRVGNSGTAISFYCDNDNAALAPKLAKSLAGANQELPDFLAAYVDSSTADTSAAERDTRKTDDQQNENFSSRTDSHTVAAAVEEDDW